MDFVHPVEAVVPGAQGRVLGALVETTAELNLRTLARLAGVSIAQVSRVMPGLVALGLVTRRDVPPSTLFSLNRQHIAASAIESLARSKETALKKLATAAKRMRPEPLSVIVFGSFARGNAMAESDIDVVMVRQQSVSGDDDRWVRAIEHWRKQVWEATGNRAEVIDVSEIEVERKLRGKTPLWRDIARDGVVAFGRRPNGLGTIVA